MVEKASRKLNECYVRGLSRSLQEQKPSADSSLFNECIINSKMKIQGEGKTKMLFKDIFEGPYQKLIPPHCYLEHCHMEI